MGTARAIRERRKAMGLAEQELASRLGISIAAYGDLESYDDELGTMVSLGEARTLATSLDTPLVDLLGLKPSDLPQVSLSQAAEMLRTKTTQVGTSLDRVEDEVGWYLSGFFENPTECALANPVEFLRDVAQYLQIDLTALVASNAA